MSKDTLKSISEEINELTSKKERLTPKQKEFVKEYLNTGNGTQSALKVYNTKSENMAAVIAHGNIRKDKIKIAIEKASGGAISRIEELSISAKNENVKLAANKDLLDRAGYKPVEKLANADGSNIVPVTIFLPEIKQSDE